ncbi:MAG TPA: aminodeoxychorismate/anthranilate synthase component II [Flavobacteriaceae bacterium]|nr:aminodeoxychorismate/anthranilate synthase component II [Flavobacteriaceae bacterium]
MKKVLVIDNYDSFVYNMVHYLEAFSCDVQVRRNDQFLMGEAENYDKILLSPGPGLPDEAGLLKALVKEFAPTKSILGICLGQQAIAEVFGGSLINLESVYHGISMLATQVVDDEPLFKNLPKTFPVGRYHSWTVNHDLPKCLETTSVDENNCILSLRHRNFDLRAVQFHPESILTPHGKTIVQNWLES